MKRRARFATGSKNDFSQLSDPRENTWDGASMRVSIQDRPRRPALTELSPEARSPTGRPEYIKNNYRNQACSRES